TSPSTVTAAPGAGGGAVFAPKSARCTGPGGGEGGGGTGAACVGGGWVGNAVERTGAGPRYAPAHVRVRRAGPCRRQGDVRPGAPRGARRAPRCAVRGARQEGVPRRHPHLRG